MQHLIATGGDRVVRTAPIEDLIGYALRRAQGQFPIAETLYHEVLEILDRVDGKRTGTYAIAASTSLGEVILLE